MNEKIMHETKTHGKLSFPYTVYRGNIPEYLCSFPLHWHDEMEIICVTSGIGYVTAQSERYTVQAGDMMVIMPQVVHSIEQLDDMKMEYYNILFQFSLLTSDTNDHCYDKYLKPFHIHSKTIKPHLPAGDQLNQLLLPLISDLIENRNQTDHGYELMIKSNLLAIMHHLNLHSKPISNEEVSLHFTYRRLKRLLTFVHTHYNSPISVPIAADSCGFSASHFMKIFKKFTGRSFIQYLKDYRLERAAELLANSTQKIAEISENTGFNNPSYFTRAFNEKYGMSPYNYRQLHQDTH